MNFRLLFTLTVLFIHSSCGVKDIPATPPNSAIPPLEAQYIQQPDLVTKQKELLTIQNKFNSELSKIDLKQPAIDNICQRENILRNLWIEYQKEFNQLKKRQLIKENIISSEKIAREINSSLGQFQIFLKNNALQCPSDVNNNLEEKK